MPEIIGEYIDRAATIEMRPRAGNLPRGVIHQLYDAARAESDGPLVYEMARALLETVGTGDTVLILTGAGGPPALPNSEVDGLLGAVAIARSLFLTRGAQVILMTEERAHVPTKSAIQASGMNVGYLDGSPVAHSVTYEATPIEREACEAHARQLFEKTNPKAVIGIEKLSPNASGVIHGVTGISYDEVHTKADVYFQMASDAGILTCGIGDGGNEVGFGRIRGAVAEIMPAGSVCECPCGGGTAAAVATDKLVVAAISDWGGYALSAMMAFLDGSSTTVFRAEEVSRMLLATVNAGAFDGATARPTLSDDGVPIESQEAYVTILRQLVEIGLSNLDSPGH